MLHACERSMRPMPVLTATAAAGRAWRRPRGVASRGRGGLQERATAMRRGLVRGLEEPAWAAVSFGELCCRILGILWGITWGAGARGGLASGVLKSRKLL